MFSPINPVFFLAFSEVAVIGYEDVQGVGVPNGGRDPKHEHGDRVDRPQVKQRQHETGDRGEGEQGHVDDLGHVEGHDPEGFFVADAGQEQVEPEDVDEGEGVNRVDAVSEGEIHGTRAEPLNGRGSAHHGHDITEQAAHGQQNASRADGKAETLVQSFRAHHVQ